MSDLTALQRAKLFCLLSADDIGKILLHARSLSFDAHQVVAPAGAPPKDVVVLLSGSLHVVDALEDGRLCHVGNVHPGDSVGWIACIDGLPTNTHIVAATANTRVLFVPIPLIQALFKQRPAFTQAIMTVLAGTIRHYMRTRAALSAPSVAQRIYRVLFGLTQDAATQSRVVLPKQQDLATLANTSRETVSRTLQELIRNGVLEKNGHQITIKNLPALQQLAGSSKA